MKDPIEYQHFAALVERVAVYTERLENICRSLEQYKVDHKADITNLDNRVRALENNQSNHKTAAHVIASIGKYMVGAVITAITIYLYYRMGNPSSH